MLPFHKIDGKSSLDIYQNKLVFGYLIDTLEDYVGRILRLSGTSSAPIVSNDNDSAVSYDALQITVRYYILLYSTI